VRLAVRARSRGRAAGFLAAASPSVGAPRRSQLSVSVTQWVREVLLLLFCRYINFCSSSQLCFSLRRLEILISQCVRRVMGGVFCSVLPVLLSTAPQPLG